MSADLFSGERIKHLSLDDLTKFVHDYPEAAREHAGDVTYALAGHAAEIGRLWDTVTGTDNSRQFSEVGGISYTRNRRSMTYKFRKLAGYSYP